MDLYRLIVFGHVAAVIALFVALALEWLGLRRLRSTASSEHARDWAALWRLLLPIGMPATFLVLGSGIYLATVNDGWKAGWVKVAVPSLVAVALSGAVIGPRRNRLQAAVAEAQGALTPALREQLADPLLLASWRFRAALLSGLVFEMTAKPDDDGGYVAIAAVMALAILWSGLAWRPRAVAWAAR